MNGDWSLSLLRKHDRESLHMGEENNDKMDANRATELEPSGGMEPICRKIIK